MSGPADKLNREETLEYLAGLELEVCEECRGTGCDECNGEGVVWEGMYED